MLVIYKGSNNTIILTLTESTTLDSPKYLFKFTSAVTNVSKYFIAEDISQYTYRYNEFTITETSGSEILTSGTITLNPPGEYLYEVYEQTSTTNLNPALSDNTQPIEQGRVLVIGTDQTIKRKDTTVTYKAYGT